MTGFLRRTRPTFGHAIGRGAAAAMTAVDDHGNGQLIAGRGRGNEAVQAHGHSTQGLIHCPRLHQRFLAQVKGDGPEQAAGRRHGLHQRTGRQQQQAQPAYKHR
ncbi:MAG: hypothetical protein IT190_08555 [Microbacteriaceae bacterium]|nr:hypothetical protein [Microbacteriaceae bacterium]